LGFVLPHPAKPIVANNMMVRKFELIRIAACPKHHAKETIPLTVPACAAKA
jgi:hypothetical protein